MRADAPARELVAPRRLVPDAAEYRDVHRAVEAFAGRVGKRDGLVRLFPEVAGDLLKADDRIDVAGRRHALATPCERPEFGIDLRGELREQCQLLAAPRRA